MRPLSKKIVKIAFAARKLTEEFAKKHPTIGNEKTLQGYCAIGSKILLLLAKKYKFEVTFIQGQYGKHYYDNPYYLNHCWIEYNSRIIDITATQFNIKDSVYIVEKNHNYYHPVYTHDRMIGDWRNQNPNKYFFIKELVDKTTVK